MIRTILLFYGLFRQSIRFSDSLLKTLINQSRETDRFSCTHRKDVCIDAPILKSGKRTKYKNLPPTVIIFITQEDIFGKDLAMYTFLEKCEEVEDLYLDDGTKKIFLNMKSKNGREELVSLLQYMERSTLENSNIMVKDPRIVRLDEIVTEVKQSEEWEANRMNIYEMGIERGIERGIEKGEKRGGLKMLFHLVKEGLLSIVDAAKEAGLSEDDFLKQMNASEK